MRWISLLGCVLALASVASSQLNARLLLSHTARQWSLTTTDGESVRAQVTSLDGDTARLKLVLPGGGGTTVARKLDEFDLESQLYIRAAVAPETPDAFLALSEEAAEAGLMRPARQGLAHARMLAGDPTIGSAVEAAMHRARAKQLEDQFEQDLSESQVTKARGVLATLEHQYGDVVSADQVASMEGQIDALLTAKADAYTEQKEAAEREREAQRRESLMKPIDRLITAAQRNHTAALKAKPSSSESRNYYDNALTASDRALRMIQSLEKRHGDDQELMARAAAQRSSALDILRSTLIDSASGAMLRGQYNKAMSYVNRILAYDPDDRQALAMRGRIEVAANSGWRYY